MLKNDIFIRKKYKDILFGILLFYCITVIGEFVDSTIAGQFIGESAVAAVEIIASITFLYGGVALLISVGFQILHSREMGKFDNASASNVFLHAIFTSIIFGIFIFFISVIFAEPFLRISGCTGKLFDDAKEYYTFFPHIGFIYSIGYVLTYLAINDGQSKILTISSIGYVVSNTLLSIILVRPLGLKGLGLSTLIATIIQALILASQFFSKTNSIVKIKFRFDFKLNIEMLKYGFFALLGYTCIFAVDIILHNFILAHYKEGYLAAYTIVNLFLDFAVVFEAFSEAGTAVAGVYMGEKNHLGVKKTMRVYLFSILMMGIVFTSIFIGGASFIPEIYAIETPEFYEASKMTSIIMGISGIATALLYAPMNMYSCLGHPHAGEMFSFLFNGIFPIALGIPLGLKFGYLGMVWGIALSPVATLIVSFSIMIIIYGKKDFPYYLGENEYTTYMYCINSKNSNSYNNFSEMTNNLINDVGISKQQTELIYSFSKNMVEKIIELNNNSKIIIEITIMISKDVIKIIFRDNGILFDFNENKLLLQNSLNQDVFVDSIGEENIKHLITTSTNRNSIVIRRK